MRNERGEIIIGLVIFFLVTGLLLGGFFLTKDLPCDDKTQHCIHVGKYGSGSFEAPTGQPKEGTP